MVRKEMTQIIHKGQMYASTVSLDILIFETCLLYILLFLSVCDYIEIYKKVYID